MNESKILFACACDSYVCLFIYYWGYSELKASDSF